jgi:hypothetical protein
MSESSVIKISKAGEIRLSSVRSKTLNISSGLRKPRKVVDFPLFTGDKIRTSCGRAKKAERHADFYRNIILTMKCSSRHLASIGCDVRLVRATDSIGTGNPFG